ncbi:MAG: hypothetical protein JWM88_3378 [Verrucomicrobia bacterium]|nr:hypothetical protein [Verrucomicrobiota bacterium]
MKSPLSFLRRGFLAAAFSLITLTAASAAETFEGRVHMDMTSGKRKEPMGIDYAMKEGKLRVDMPQEGNRRGGGSGGMIYDAQNQEVIILMEHDGQKNFMRRSMKEAIARAQEKGQDDRQHPAPVATGRTEVIAGYKASEYTYTDEKGEVTELWLAKGLGTFMYPAAQNPMGGRGAPSPQWEKIAREGGFFPLRVVSRNSKGAEASRMEVTRIEKTSLPDSLFSTDGYTEFKMPDFGGAFNPFKR